jgi:hypothetical protein
LPASHIGFQQTCHNIKSQTAVLIDPLCIGLQLLISFVWCAEGVNMSFHPYWQCVLGVLQEAVHRDFPWFLEEELVTKTKHMENMDNGLLAYDTM